MSACQLPPEGKLSDPRAEGPRCETKLIEAGGSSGEELASLLEPAVELLKRDEVVAFPTETVYGLGANALSDAAVAKIFQAKGRPSDNPLIVHISSLDMLPLLTSFSADSQDPRAALVLSLTRRFWPGPLTLLFPKSAAVSSLVTCGVSTVAVRMPSHPVALALISQAALPLAAPSANVSGRPSPTSAEHVWADLHGLVPCVVSAGPSAVGLESTVVDVWRSPPLVLRPGGVTLEQLRLVDPSFELFQAAAADLHAPATPGLKYRHYSPDTAVSLLIFPDSSASDSSLSIAAKVISHVELQLASLPADASVAVVRTQSRIVYPQSFLDHPRIHFRQLFRDDSPNESLDVAAGMFATLRELEKVPGLSRIFFECVPEKDEGVAVMNRIRKASSSILQL